MKRCVTLIGLFAVFVFSGCATESNTLYSWGSYETQLYSMYCVPGETPPERQLERMEADIEIARSKGLPLPPGFRAHMGYLYFQTGNYDLAEQSFEAEKAAFPESAKLMDRFIEKMKE